MIRNNLKLALRFLKAHKVFTIINIIGLSIALSVSFVILLYVINEFSYNGFNENGKRIYRVLNYAEDFNSTQPGAPYILASTLKEEFPQVEKAINVRYFGGFRLKLQDEFIRVNRTLATNSDIFEIFTFPLIMGASQKNLLDDQNSLVLSRELAEKFFPDENPVGKEIEGMANNEEHTFIITGVIEEIPRNSTLRAKCFINSKWSLAPINKSFKITNADLSWVHNFWSTWILISEGSSAAALENQFESFEKKYLGENSLNHYSLQKLSDVYLNSEHIQNAGLRGNMKNVKLFSLISFLIILVAAINYIVLSTVVSSFRSKEIAMRKTFGASNRNIQNQMLSESVLLAILILPIVIVLTWLALPYAGKLFHKELIIIEANVIKYVSIYIAVTVLIGISSGLYTSIYLSRIKVLDILKNIIYIGKRKVLVRSSLIVIQLVVFCTLLACVLAIRAQYDFAITKDTGHHRQNILQVDLGRNFNGYEAYLNKIRSHSDVVMAAGVMEGVPMLGSMNTMYQHFENKELQVKVEGLACDYGYLQTMGIELTQGRYFSLESGSDLKNSVILNETAVKQLGIKDPIGAKMGNQTIVGVVKDFNLHSVHTDIPPMTIHLTDKYLHKLVVHYKPGKLDTVVPMLEAEWKEITKDRPFNFVALEDIFRYIYSEEKSLTTIVSISAIFTFLIAIIGLFGLTLFVAKTRTKEIGIKKVLGSSERSILFSLLYENLVLVVIATLLSIPITYYFISKWLNNFAYKVSINGWIFLFTFIIAAVVVLIAVYFQSSKAARVNPVDALRYE